MEVGRVDHGSEGSPTIGTRCVVKIDVFSLSGRRKGGVS